MNKIIILLFTVFFLGSCAQRLSYLPEIDAIETSPYGSYIHINTSYKQLVRGELLAVNGDSLIIGSIDPQLIYYIDTSKVTDNYIQLYRNKSYAIAPFIAISHGWWLVFTVPINTIISISMSVADKKESRYYNKNFNELHKYARYPQGLPEEFRISDFKPAVSSNK